MLTPLTKLLLKTMLAQSTWSKARHANDSLHKDGSEVVVVAYTPEDKSAIKN